MSQPSPKTVWFDTDRTRYFVIPDDEVVPPGDLFLRSARGAQRSVDAELVEAYAAPREEAVRLMREEFDEAVGRVKGSLSELFNLGGRREGAKGVDGDQLLRGLGKVLGTAVSAVQETLTNPAVADDARERAGHVAEDFKGEAEKLEPALQQVGEKLREALRSPEVTGALHDLGAGLQDLARSFQRSRGSAAGEAAEPLDPEKDDRHDQQGEHGGAEHAADDGDRHGGTEL